MKKKDLDQWIAALRSGEYEQGFGYLCSSDGGDCQYCCLGVMIEELYDGEWEKNDYGSWMIDKNPLLPESKVLKSLKLDHDVVHELAGYNDSGWSFQDIADWLEQNRERLQ